MERAKELYLELDKVKDPIQRIDILYALSFEFLNSDIERCENLINEAYDLCVKNQYQTGIIEYYRAKGRVHFKRAQYEDAMAAFEKGCELATESNDLMTKANLIDGMGMVYWSLGNLEKSFEKSKEALRILDELGTGPAFKAMPLNNIGNYYERKNDFEKALESYQKALDVLKELGNHKLTPVVRANTAVILGKQKRYDESLEIYLLCLEEFIETNNRPAESLTLVNIGNLYLAKKDYAKALDYFQRALKLFKQVVNKKAEGEAWIGLGKVYIKFGGFDIAEDYIKKGWKILSGIEYALGQCLSLEALGELYLEMQQPEEALPHLKKYEEIAINTGMTSELENLRPLLYRVYSMLGQMDKADEYKQ